MHVGANYQALILHQMATVVCNDSSFGEGHPCMRGHPSSEWWFPNPGHSGFLLLSQAASSKSSKPRKRARGTGTYLEQDCHLAMLQGQAVAHRCPKSRELSANETS